MAESRTVEQWIRGVPPDLKEAVRREVESRGESMNDLLVGILAAHFEIPFEKSGRKAGVVADDKLDLLLRMPPELRRRIKTRAAAADTNGRDLIVRVLSEHFGTRFAFAPRQARRPVRAAA